MDALLSGYGSDSDCSNSPVLDQGVDKRVERDVAKGTGHQEVSSSSFASLLGEGQSSDDEEDTNRASATQSQQPPKKKQRFIDGSNENSFLSRHGLPSSKEQFTSNTTVKNDSMISWETDFLSQIPSHRDILSSTKASAEISNQRPTFEKYEELVAKLAKDNIKSLACHLKSQKEFHNPRYFKSVIEQLRIQDPLGSQIETRINRQER